MLVGINARWLRPTLLALAGLLLIGWFSRQISDPDFWWHLKTGQYIAQQHQLPVPDPFAYTTAASTPAYPGEPRTRYFNLTHEWLAQVLLYCVFAAGGFAGVVLFRTLMLTAACALVGLVVYRRTGGLSVPLAASLAAAGVLEAFAADRPLVLTFLCVIAVIYILERRGRALWILPPLMLFWANCHGGYFLGWVVMAAYSVEALLRWRRRRALPGDRTLFAVCALSIGLSGLNPNGFRIPLILGSYRNSYLQSRLLEWAPTVWWPPRWYTWLLIAAIGVVLWARRRVRPVDWLLLAAFTAAAFSAYRNVALIGLLAPIVIASYLPEWKRADLPLLQFFAALALAAALIVGAVTGNFFEFRVNPWKWPAGAADFLAQHHITQPIFNTYEYGGYFIWRLAPAQRVFIDGRALSESVFLDYARILYNHDESGGKSASQLLEQYGVEALVVNGFEYASGNLYKLVPALADPAQNAWTLVYSDPQALIFLRHPPADLPPLPSLAVFDHLEAECELHLQHEPEYPRCARTLGQMFTQVGQYVRARRWIGVYLSLPHDPDREAEDAFRRLLGAGQ